MPTDARRGPIVVRLLGAGDCAVLGRVADDVFDGPVDRALAAEFLDDPRHHVAVAIDDGAVVGMATAVHYVHPDKPPELWINEVGVAPTHRRLGLGRRLLAALLDHARTLGCRAAWVLTERDNVAARRLYAAAGGVEADEPPVMVSYALTDDSPATDPDPGV
jgi:ribosomal protein S18 acetylase RimI-like enzyme